MSRPTGKNLAEAVHRDLEESLRLCKQVRENFGYGSIVTIEAPLEDDLEEARRNA